MDKLPIVNTRPANHFSVKEIELLLRSEEVLTALGAEENGEALVRHVQSVSAADIRNAFALRPICQIREEGSKSRGIELYSLVQFEAAYRTAVDFASRK